MASLNPLRKRSMKSLTIAGALLLVLVFSIDDWRRDFTSHHAEISFKSEDHRLKPLVSERTADELVVALQWAARRIGGWQFVGTSTAGADTRVLFVHGGRLLPLREDILMRVHDRGRDRVVSGQSTSRWEIPDLGRNPRNLRRLLRELEAVIAGSE